MHASMPYREYCGGKKREGRRFAGLEENFGAMFGEFLRRKPFLFLHGYTTLRSPFIGMSHARNSFPLPSTTPSPRSFVFLSLHSSSPFLPRRMLSGP